MAWKIILYYHIYICFLCITCLYSYSYSLLLWDFNSMWIIWSEINGALKRLSEMWIVSDEGIYTHKYAQIKELLFLHDFNNVKGIKFHSYQRHMYNIQVFFGFLYCQDQKTVNHNPHIQNRTHESHSRAFQSLKAIVVSLCV